MFACERNLDYFLHRILLRLSLLESLSGIELASVQEITLLVKRICVSVLVIMLVCAVSLACVVYGIERQRAHVWNAGGRYIASPAARAVLTRFAQPSPANPLARTDYEKLAAYLQDGFHQYAGAELSTANYLGLPSEHGLRRDQTEAFARIAPLLAASLLHPGEPHSARAAQAEEILLQGWTHGSDPSSPGYWGTMRDKDQLIVESADIALSVWLMRDTLWRKLTPAAQRNLMTWLLQVNNKHAPDNNWLLFFAFDNVVAYKLGFPGQMPIARARYERAKSFYRGHGWFTDGPGGKFDYYNAWAFAYELFWIDQVEPNFDPSFIHADLQEQASQFQFLFGPEGFPLMGRSICYRMGAIAPLVLVQAQDAPSVSAGRARRTMNLVWSYFVRHGALKDGRITQGYCADDERTVDPYSGPASCLWATRPLVVALYQAPQSAFWTAPEEKLPVEAGDYQVQFAVPGWTVRGENGSTIVLRKAGSSAPIPLEEESLPLRVYDRLRGTMHRPGNERAKYDQAEYRSDKPFCGCAAEK